MNVALGLASEQDEANLSYKLAKRSGKPSASYATSLPLSSGFGQTTFEANPSSVIIESPTLEALPEAGSEIKGRARRASDGSRLSSSKAEGKRPVNGELKCTKCGKGYKHSSCLQKHLLVTVPPEAARVQFRACKEPFLTFFVQVGTHSGMVYYLQALNLEAPASPIVGSCSGIDADETAGCQR